jgi:hypothetical protein
LNVPEVTRQWIDDLEQGKKITTSTPTAYLDWVEHNRYHILQSDPTTIIRDEGQQLPQTDLGKEILSAVYNHFKDKPHSFEPFAARIYELHDNRVRIDEITRGVMDGGRDAIGRYLLGLNEDPIYVDFFLEAKCYSPGLDGKSRNRVGVKEASRIISRIRNRQFGILVTTSVIAPQAYSEVRTDGHPIVFITGRDIADILIRNGYNSVEAVNILLTNDFFL